MPHCRVPEADEILDKPFPVLDHGFVRLVDYMGSDARIVEAARVSYGKGTRTVREDSALIDYLMRHRHTSPFEHVVFEFHCKMPIFVARQWIRHRTARVNEISGRYSVMRDEFYLPPPDQIRRQSTENKQGRAETVPPELQQRVIEMLRQGQASAYAAYEALIHEDIARELARINLPLSLYTEWYWQMDLHNLFHFLELRLDPHAQWEIREYAKAIAEIVKKVTPLAWASFERHVLRGCRLSEEEINAVRALVAGRPNPLTGRRLTEFNQKLFGEAAGALSAAPTAPASELAAEPPEFTPSGFRVRLSPDEVHALPLRQFEGPVHLIAEPEAVAPAVAELRKHRILGFDTESRPAFRPGESYPVSILQLAGENAVWIFQLRRLGEAREELWDLLADPAYLKVGVAVKHDLAKLQALAPFEPNGFVDLAAIAAHMGIKNHGLRGLCAIILGFRISKRAQRSNWAREPLTPVQLTYAATDAWAGREIYLELARRGLISPDVS